MNSTSLEIRALTPADAIAFRTLRLLAISDSPAAVWPTHDEEAGRTIPEIEARIQMTASQVVFGAFADTKLVGFAGLRREVLEQVRHKALLWGVFVSPDWRREGLARKLLSQATAHARARGVLQIHRSLGFKAYGLEPRALRVGDVYFDEEHMVLRLDE
jgi:GNAT superfamily N-acetyltransferase